MTQTFNCVKIPFYPFIISLQILSGHGRARLFLPSGVSEFSCSVPRKNSRGPTPKQWWYPKWMAHGINWY